MRHLIIALFVLPFLAPPLPGELPDFYKTVDRLVWVVGDLDRTAAQLGKIGFTNFQDLGEAELDGVTFRSHPATGSIRIASGRFADAAAYWIQPMGGDNAYAEFLAKHKTGVFSLVHRVPTEASFTSELERMKGMGVAILQQGIVRSSSGTIRYAFLDTQVEGKYVLGLVCFPGGDEGPLAVPLDNPSGRQLTQYAFAVRRLEPVSAFWAELGLSAMSFTHNKLRDLRYHGHPAEFDMRLGWQRHGKVAYEWIQSLQGPDVYRDHMKVHGEGLHHLAFNVPDMDKDLGWWGGRGFPESMSGAWGEKDKPGSGRFAYVNAQSLGGTDIELLWNYK